MITKRRRVINYITQTAIFGGLAAILYCVPGLQFNLPFLAPGFMSVHLDEIPILISSFAYGPLLGVFEILLKTLIKLPMTSSLCVGELGDMMYSLAFIIPAALIYKKNRTLKGAAIGLTVGVICNLIMTTIVNLYTIFPFYKMVYGFPNGYIASSFNAIFNWNLTNDLDPRIAVLLIPFNLVKDIIVVSITFVCYKPLRFICEKFYKY